MKPSTFKLMKRLSQVVDVIYIIGFQYMAYTADSLRDLILWELCAVLTAVGLYRWVRIRA